MAGSCGYRLVGVFAVALVLNGCAGVRVHSPTRDKQGEELKTTWGQVDLKGLIATERDNLNKLLATELDTQDKIGVAIRDQRLSAMLLSQTTTKGLTDPVKERLAAITSSPEAWSDLLKERAVFAQSLELPLREFRRNSLRVPSCDEFISGKAQKNIGSWLETHKNRNGAALKAALSAGTTQCTDWKKKETELLAKLGGGELAAASARLEADEKELKDQKDAQKDLRDKFTAARKEYDEAVKDAAKNPSSRDAVRAKANNLKEARDALEKAPDSFTNKFLSEEKLAAIDDFFKVVTETKPGETPPAGTGKAALAVVLLSNVVDGARAGQAEADKLLVAPLLLRKTHEELNLEAATRDIEAQEAVIRFDREIVETLSAQAVQLKAAQDKLATQPLGNPIATKYANRNLLAAFAEGTPAEKEVLYDAAARYLDAINRLETRRHKLEYSRLAAQHERALAYAEVNVKQWESLIGGTVDQLSAYGAGGIKPEQITNILNTLGILWIGAGVN